MDADLRALVERAEAARVVSITYNAGAAGTLVLEPRRVAAVVGRSVVPVYSA